MLHAGKDQPLPLFCKREEGDRPCPFDSHRRFPLMTETIAGNPPRNNASPLGQKIPQQSHVLEVNRHFFMTEPAYAPALK